MATRDLKLLDPQFQEQVRKLLQKCEKDGYVMKPFYTLRSVQEQAKLYRQSRSWNDIQAAASYLKENGAHYLSKVLLEVGPQSGKWATNALPGFSWHQHGEAIDCYWLVDGSAEWSTTKMRRGKGIFDNDPKNGYQVYAEHAMNLGLEAGHFWKNKDSVHVQMSKGSVLNLINDGTLSWEYLDGKMKDMFDV